MRSNYMIAIILAVNSVLILPTGCRQQEQHIDIMQAPEPTPKITFENLEYDFGKVGPRVKNVGQFKFTNTGNATLRISEVEKCCGVITKLEKTEYAPGQSGILTVEYRSGTTDSTMSKHLYVNSNDGSNPRITLTIRAKVEFRVTWEPKSLSFLLKDEGINYPEITIESIENEPFSISRFQSTGNCITADIDSSVQATKFILQPKVVLEKTQKRRSGRIFISLDYTEPNVASEAASIMFRIMSRFSVRPSILVASYGEQRKPQKKTVMIVNNYGEDFEIESTSSRNGHIEVLEQKKIDKTYQIELQITPPPEENIMRFTDKLTINMKDGERLDVSCQGIYSVRENQITTSGQ